jgi:hypothetical protein
MLKEPRGWIYRFDDEVIVSNRPYLKRMPRIDDRIGTGNRKPIFLTVGIRWRLKDLAVLEGSTREVVVTLNNADLRPYLRTCRKEADHMLVVRVDTDIFKTLNAVRKEFETGVRLVHENRMLPIPEHVASADLMVWRVGTLLHRIRTVPLVDDIIDEPNVLEIPKEGDRRRMEVGSRCVPWYRVVGDGRSQWLDVEAHILVYAIKKI